MTTDLHHLSASLCAGVTEGGCMDADDILDLNNLLSLGTQVWEQGGGGEEGYL